MIHIVCFIALCFSHMAWSKPAQNQTSAKQANKAKQTKKIKKKRNQTSITKKNERSTTKRQQSSTAINDLGNEVAHSGYFFKN